MIISVCLVAKRDRLQVLGVRRKSGLELGLHKSLLCLRRSGDSFLVHSFPIGGCVLLCAHITLQCSI